MDIYTLGWNDWWEEHFAAYRQKGLLAARIISNSGAQLRLVCGGGEHTGQLSGKYRHAMQAGMEAPVIGDWVAAELREGTLMIHALLERRTCFARKPAISGGRKLKRGVIDGGVTERQALAANIDTVFVVTGLDGNFNPSRIERFLTVAASGGAVPVLLLNKADLCPDPREQIDVLKDIARGVAIHIVSAATGAGLGALAEYLRAGSTVAFLGSSGAGKSTLVNRLFGMALQGTKEVSASSGKGRHMTTRAELFVHESGAMLIDTPGIRELQLWCGEEAVEDRFEDVAALVRQCRYSDCRHGNEPGCAIRAALANGTLDTARYRSFLKLDAEAQRLEQRKKQRDVMLGRMRKQKGL